MAKLFAQRIVDAKQTFADVPAKLKEAVAAVLINDFDRPDLVPAEYGGNAR